MSVTIATNLETLNKTTFSLIEGSIKPFNGLVEKNHKGKVYAKEEDSIEVIVEVNVIY